MQGADIVGFSMSTALVEPSSKYEGSGGESYMTTVFNSFRPL